MSFTYTAGATPKDDVRLLIGDVDGNAMLDVRLEDEEIVRLLELEGSTLHASATAAEALAAKFARKAEGSSGGLVPSRTRAQELTSLAARIRARASSSAVPTAGGITISSRQTQDPNRIQPAFRRGMLDNPDGSQVPTS